MHCLRSLHWSIASERSYIKNAYGLVLYVPSRMVKTNMLAQHILVWITHTPTTDISWRVGVEPVVTMNSVKRVGKSKMAFWFIPENESQTSPKCLARYGNDDDFLGIKNVSSLFYVLDTSKIGKKQGEVFDAFGNTICFVQNWWWDLIDWVGFNIPWARSPDTGSYGVKNEITVHHS